MKRRHSIYLITLLLLLSTVGVAHGLSASRRAMPPNFTVAFIGDQGSGENAQAVLRLIKEEGADMVLHQGDFDYHDNPEAWDAMISEILGENFPFFATIGNHDVRAWPHYQQKLRERLARVRGARCTGDLGVQSACRYRGLFFVMTAPGIRGSGHEEYIQKQLQRDRSLWSICSWHKNQGLMQVGEKKNETGWGVYEACREGGAIIATAHEHSYSRTHLLENFEMQTIASTSEPLILEKGKTFAFVSGLGGHSIRDQEESGDFWAAISTSDQGANFGALLCTFFVDGDPRKGRCMFKDIQGRVVDEFEVRSALE